MPDSIPNEPPAPGGADRRLWPRGPGKVAEVLLRASSGDTCRVVVLDESLTGLAVVLDGRLRLQQGEEVQICYEDAWNFALVKHVQPAGQNKYQVGLEWGCSESRFAGLNEIIEAFCAQLTDHL